MHWPRRTQWAVSTFSVRRFVQVVQGQVTDLAEARPHKDSLQGELAAHLPCLLGTLTVEHDGKWFTRVLYSHDSGGSSSR